MNVVRLEDYRPKYDFPLSPIHPQEWTPSRLNEMWERVKGHVLLLDDETIEDPSQMVRSLVDGTTYAFDLGKGDGLIWLYGIRPGHTATLNIIIWNPVSLRRKVGPFGKAGNVALSWLMEKFKLRKLKAFIDPDNKKSWKMAEVMGFELEGCIKEEILRNGEWRDLKVYGLLRRNL